MYTYIYGADSETNAGKPVSLQFYSEDYETDYIIFVDEYTAMDQFFGWLDSLPRHATHVVYCHNLKFDLVSFFYAAHRRLDSEFDFTFKNWNVSGCFGAPTFAKIRKNTSKDHRTIYLVDSYLWYQGSLAQAAELFCPGLPKLERPKDLGTRNYSEKDDDFVAYAMRDAEVAYHIGSAVQAIHSQFNIPQSVSLAHMASNIFRTHYLDYTIPQPPQDRIIEAALMSYHGGKNNVVSGAAPKWHTDVYAYDISSAYPYAMSDLPAFSDDSLYRHFKRSAHTGEVPPFGVYKVAGKLEESEWPVLFSHSFEPLSGNVRGIWVQGLELNQAIASGLFKPSSISGYYYEHERDNVAPALRNFVTDFYARKQTETERIWRHMYKITLNSLYGKFIQTRKKKAGLIVEIDPVTDAPKTLGVEMHATAGGMYHPFIASAITAHTRAYMHEVELAYEAIHTATDGIYSKRSTFKRIPGRPSKGLGSLQREGNGTLLLLRNKCYVLYTDDKSQGFPSRAFHGKRILKFAKHGFQGSVYDLEYLIAKNRRKYQVNRAIQLKESRRQGKQVNAFESRDMVLKVGPVEVD